MTPWATSWATWAPARPHRLRRHIDTVGIGNKANWNFDPYEGFESETEIGGRGTSDQLGGIVSAVYGARIMKDLGLLSDKYTVLVTGTVQEEDCDAFAGSISSTKTRSARNLSFLRNRQTAASIAASAAVWKSASTSRAFPATQCTRTR